MIIPSYLHPNDTIGITAPASSISREDIDDTIKTLESWGLNVSISKTIGSKFNQFAATDSERLSELQMMLDDPEIKAILCARGGYGTIRIIDKIDFSKFVKHPKWLIGFSDITVLHSHINNVYGIQTIHGPMPKTFSKSQKSNNLLKDALFGNLKSYSIKSHKDNKTGKAKGVLVGGNLSLIHTLIGSRSDFDPKNTILIFEDIGEYLYNIDRMLWGIRRAKDINTLAGIIVGNFTDIKDNETAFGKTVYEIFTEHFSDYDIPVCLDFPAGHDEVNYPFYLGRSIQLEVTQDTTTLIFE